MMRRMNKRGDLLNNILGVVIAVIGILVIFGGAYMLYQKYVNQESEKAKNTIDVLEAKINAIEVGQSTEALVRGLPGWFVAGWGKAITTKPDKCFLSICLCICKGSAVQEADKVKVCQNNGFCRKIAGDDNFDADTIVFLRDNFYSVTIKKVEGEISLKENE
ncbi:MAG: hypothetical protein Q8L29_00865 [archaeon]|nr:hypothetical protein [archaeon]